MAVGGGTNAVIHLLALAGRVGVPLTLDRFDELSRRDAAARERAPVGRAPRRGAAPCRRHPAVLHELAPLLHSEALTVTGTTLAEGFAAADIHDRAVIASRDAPLAAGAASRSSAAPSLPTGR